MAEKYLPRFSFEITEEQRMRADSVIDQYGMRKALFGIILDDVLDLLEQYGGVAIGVILSKKLKPRDILPTLHQIEETKNERSK